MLKEQDYTKTFIIVPAYNEQEAISKVLDGLASLGCPIVVIDDGSLESIKDQVSKHKNVFYIRHKVNLGQGAALQTGIDFAVKQGAAYIVSFDADGQHRVADIPAILSPVVDGEADIVLASRFLAKGHHNAPFLKRIVLKTGRWVNYFFTGLYLSDAHNGLRAMNRLAAITIRISENRMAHATEIIAQIKKHKLRYKEVAASVVYTDYSRQKCQSVLNSLKIFFDLVLQKLFR
jgi:polyprenyl-phospho-N-acetylgalactosaminyl synthase